MHQSQAKGSAKPWDRRIVAIVARLAFASIAAWIALVMTTRALGADALAAALDLPFSILCHRIPERVLSIGGQPMPLCSRCAGLWIGLSVSAALARPSLSMAALRVVFASAAAFMLVEVVTQDLGLHPVFHPTRLLSGLLLSAPFGGAIGALVKRELSPPRSR